MMSSNRASLGLGAQLPKSNRPPGDEDGAGQPLALGMAHGAAEATPLERVSAAAMAGRALVGAAPWAA